MPACRPSPSSGCAPTPQLGLLAVVFLIVIVVTSDTAGFFAGRLLGGPKLWPRVSPNKTWAGFVGALVASSDRRRPVLVCGSGRLGGAAGGDRRRAVVGGPGRRSRQIGHQASLRRQGYERADPRPWRRHGSRRRAGGRGDGGRLWPPSSSTCIRPRTRCCSGLEDGRPACRQCVQDGWRQSRRRRRAGAPPARASASACSAPRARSAQSTLDLIGRNPHLFEVVALTAQSNVEALADWRVRHRAALAVVADEQPLRRPEGAPGGQRHRGRGRRRSADRGGRAAGRLRDGGHHRRRGPATRPGGRSAGPPRGARQQGMPGLGGRDLHGGRAPRPAPSWCRSTRSIRRSSRRSPAPIPAAIERIVLTASGGPFRTWSLEAAGARHARSRRCCIPTGRWAARSPSTRPP